MRLLPALILAPTLAAAHPHEFVEAALTLRLDAQGHLVEIGVEWRYDPFTSMLILSDLGLDPTATDLAPQDAPTLQGFDQDWAEGYNGDLWPSLAGVALDLAPMVPGPVEVRGGQVVSRHARPLLQPADPRAGDLNIRVYDPEFYVAYTIAVPPVMEGGAGCAARVYGPDMEAAHEILETALAELVDSADIEMAFPMVGAHFADELRLICD